MTTTTATTTRDSGLIRSLTAVVTNTLHVQDFCKVVVGAAVEDALLRVARDHGLNYRELVDKYRDPVVAQHASAAGVTVAGRCKGVTRTGKQCSKPSQLNGYCPAHADQWAEDESKRRCVEAYRHKAATTAATTAAASAAASAAPIFANCKPSSNALDLL